jgi:hypothetical protein
MTHTFRLFGAKWGIVVRSGKKWEINPAFDTKNQEMQVADA